MSADTGIVKDEKIIFPIATLRIFDVEMKIDMGAGLPQGTRTKLTFVVWAPSTASIKQKMVSASSKDALKKKFDGVQVIFRAWFWFVDVCFRLSGNWLAETSSKLLTESQIYPPFRTSEPPAAESSPSKESAPKNSLLLSLLSHNTTVNLHVDIRKSSTFTNNDKP